MSVFRTLSVSSLAACAFAVAGCSGAATAVAPAVAERPAASVRAAGTERARAPFAFGPDVLRAAATTRALSSIATVAPACTALTFNFPGRGTVTLTAAVVGPVSNAKVNAAGCDIGIYLDASANGAVVARDSIVDANQFGVLAIGTQNLSVAQLAISRIGNHDADGTFDPNGVQTGVGLYFEGVGARVTTTTIGQYQKNGTAFNGGSSVALSNTTAIGAGTVDYIAQNGIQYYNSTVVAAAQNVAKANVYDNPEDPIYDHQATGFLVLCTNLVYPVQALNLQRSNYATANDFNFYISNATSDGC